MKKRDNEAFEYLYIWAVGMADLWVYERLSFSSIEITTFSIVNIYIKKTYVVFPVLYSAECKTIKDMHFLSKFKKKHATITCAEEGKPKAVKWITFT